MFSERLKTANDNAVLRSTASTGTTAFERKRIYITYVDSLGPYIKVSGLMNSDALSVIRRRMEKLAPNCTAINPISPAPHLVALLLPGTWCLYKNTSDVTMAKCEFIRARIIRIVPGSNSQVPSEAKVHFADYGYTTTVSIYQLMFPQNQNELHNFPVLCSQYIVLGVSEDWNKQQLDEISRIIKYFTVDCIIIKEIKGYTFITMKWNNINFDEYIILHKNMGVPIANEIVFNGFDKILKEYASDELSYQSTDVKSNTCNMDNAATKNINKNNININDNNNYGKIAPLNGTNLHLEDSSTKGTHYTNSSLTVNNGATSEANKMDGAEVYKRMSPLRFQRPKDDIRHASPLANRLQCLQASAQYHKPVGPNYSQKFNITNANTNTNINTNTNNTTNNTNYENMMTYAVQPYTPVQRMQQLPQLVGNLTSVMPDYQQERGQSHIRGYGGIHPNSVIPTTMNKLNYRQPFYYKMNKRPNQLPKYSPEQTTLPSLTLTGALPIQSNFNSNFLNALKNDDHNYSKPSTSSASAMNNQFPPSLSSRLTSATFKSNTLTVGKVYDVSVSFVENGPFLFSVQLVAGQKNLTEMMNRIEKIFLQPLKEKPTLGIACIARYSEDGQLYRALVIRVQPSSCKVAYIDYGNAEYVNNSDLYEIPDEFLIYKTFAMRFTLSGHKELEPIDESLKKAFKDLVMYKNCKLKVMPLEGPPLVQYCQLFLQPDDTDVLDILKQIQKKRLVYAKAEPLCNNDVVEIRYIDSPKHFYVQKVNNIPAFEQLMDDMYLYYNKNQVVPNHLALGAPCIVKYENEWYRAEVMRTDASNIMVRHVDFGYEQTVTKNLLSTIAEPHLKLPRQAVQCCLKGFENNEMTKDLATTQFEMLAEETNLQRRSFTVKVFRIEPDGVNVVNLFTKVLNVMKKLYKLSMPFEQYLHFEKTDFNEGLSRQKALPISDLKTPSIASSSEVTASINSTSSSTKANSIKNNTKTNDGQLNKFSRGKQQKDNFSKLSQSKSVHKFSSTPSLEYDNQSSGYMSKSTPGYHNSRSTSSEFKQTKQNNFYKHRNYQQNIKFNSNNVPGTSGSSIASADSKSTDSKNSSNYFSNGKEVQQLSLAQQQNDFKPRFHQQYQDKRFKVPTQQQKNQRQRQQNKQQYTSRSQNAPDGFSQKYNSDQKLYDTMVKNMNSISLGSSSHFHNAPSQTMQQKKQQYKFFDSTEIYMPLTENFPIQMIDTPSRDEVIISWWISPHQFYVQLKSRIPEFQQFMQSIQEFYGNKPLQQLQLRIGSNVMARHRKNNTIYRARILSCNQMIRKYKVLFVDLGNHYTVTSEDIWRVEKRFFNFPVMAHLCGLPNVISNFDHFYIIDRMDEYVQPDIQLECEYMEKSLTNTDLYYVNIMVKGISLTQILINDGLITRVSPKCDLELLAGQQVRAKIIGIKDMLNFKIELPYYCDNLEYIQLLCSYDDIRFVKSNQGLLKEFKHFYANKSCIVNITDINNNKVLLLRPLMPLMKDDPEIMICSPPIMFNTFNVSIVYVALPHRLYGQMKTMEVQMGDLLSDMYDYYSKEGSLLKSFKYDQICAAKGSDDNWYRARIITENIPPDNEIKSLNVYCIDYGNIESVAKENLKYLDDRFHKNINGFCVEINLPIKSSSSDDPQNKYHSGKTMQDDQLNTSNINYSNGTESTTKFQLQPSDIKVIKYLSAITLNAVIEVKVVEMRNNRLIAELVTSDNVNIIDNLLKEKLILERNVDYMRGVLDKEKPNRLEYIEMVDLTVEDDGTGCGVVGGGRDVGDVGAEAKLTSTPKKENDKDNNLEVAKAEKTLNSNSASITADKSKGNSQDISSTVPTDKDNVVTEKKTPIETEPLLLKSVNESVSVIKEKEFNNLNTLSKMELGILAHCDNPAQFFIHPVNKIKNLKTLQENLQIIASSLPPLMRIINGAYCVSLYSVDKQWYRAKILDAELMVLQFIDFGNTDCISDTSDLKEMLVFPDIEPFCIPCSLPIRPNGTADWVDAANTIFNDSYTKPLKYKFILDRREERKTNFINLYIEGINVTEHLIKDGYAQPLQMADSGENCYISHLNNINNFFIQYEKNSKALELIELYLAEYKKLQVINEFVPKKIVAARFSEDDMFYRAELLKKATEGYEVLFIDYGNTSISTECREISDKDIVQLPPLSQRCSLELPSNCLSWSKAAEEKFCEISATGETVFNVELREPTSDFAIVDLFVDGHNIIDDLEELCEKQPVAEGISDNMTAHTDSVDISVNSSSNAIITHVNAVNDFYLQFSKDKTTLEDFAQTLKTINMEKVPEIIGSDGDILENLYAIKDGFQNVDRVRVLQICRDSKDQSCKYRVILIDYGYEKIVSQLYILPKHLVETKPFAIRCQLENTDIYKEYENNKVTEIFHSLLETENSLVKAKIIDNEKNIVRLFSTINQKNIGVCIKEILDSKYNEVDALNVKRAEKCIITYAMSPTNFYIQLKSNSASLDTVYGYLRDQNFTASLECIRKIEVNKLCLAYSEEDECYYRGRIVTNRPVDGDKFEVFLVDYGNSLFTSNLKEIPQKLSVIPELALCCQLNPILKFSAYSHADLEDCFTKLMEIHFGDVYDVNILDFDEWNNKYMVELQINYKDLAEELLDTLSTPTKNSDDDGEILQPPLFDAKIVHINSPHTFFIQLTEDVTSLNEISERLRDAEEKFPRLVNIKSGVQCIAQYPEDGVYYRAEIVCRFDDGKCEVHYIDFGKNSITDELRQMPDDLLNKKRYSIHCTLDDSYPINSREFSEQFELFVNSHFSETFQIQFQKKSHLINMVRVFYREKNIGQHIQEILRQEEEEYINYEDKQNDVDNNNVDGDNDNNDNDNENDHNANDDKEELENGRSK